MSTGEAASRQELIVALANAVRQELEQKPRVLVGIDGPDGAGKTMLADALADQLGGVALRASIDGFHNPRAARLQRGPLSPEGYYLNSFDYAALRSRLLAPFRYGAREIQTRVYDYRVEAETPEFVSEVPQSAVLVFDGVFLLRPEARDEWDLSVYLHVPEEQTLRRVVVRDEVLFGSADEVVARYTQRYLPGQVIYRSVSEPMARATVLVDNSAPDASVVMRWALANTPPSVGIGDQ